MPEETKSTEEKNVNSEDAERNKTSAALAYIWILCLIPLLNNKKSKFAQFHAKQGLILFGLSVFAGVPVLGQILFLAILTFSVIGFIKASNGEWWKTPIIYEWSKKIKI